MNILTEYRVKARLRQKEAAERIGVQQATVSSWETGHKMPTAENLFKCAEVYGVSFDELFDSFMREKRNAEFGRTA